MIGFPTYNIANDQINGDTG